MHHRVVLLHFTEDIFLFVLKKSFWGEMCGKKHVSWSCKCVFPQKTVFVSVSLRELRAQISGSKRALVRPLLVSFVTSFTITTVSSKF